MKVLVTGGLGFIGAEVAQVLRESSHSVTVVDDETGSVRGDIDGIVIARCSVEEFAASGVGSSPGGWDAVVHCAAPVGGLGVVHAGLVSHRIVSATEAAIRIAHTSDAILVNVSSSEVYGAPGAYTEASPCIVPPHHSPRLGYAVGKRAAELDVHTAALRGCVSVRPFNVVGPGQSAAKGFVLPRWCEQAARGEALSVFGDGSQARAFTSVHDVAPFLARLAEGLYQAPADVGVINVGTVANYTTIRALAALVNIRAGRQGDLVRFTTGRVEYAEDRYEEAAGSSKSPRNVAVAERFGWRPAWRLERIVDDALAAVGVAVRAA